MMIEDVPILGAIGPSPGAAAAIALAGLVREAVAAGVERRVLLFRPTRLTAARRREPQMSLLRDAWDALRRTSRTRVFTLPRGGLVAIEPAPAHHLMEAERTLAGMLEPVEAAASLALLRLPDQAAAVLAAVEEALGLVDAVRTATRPVAGRAPEGDSIAAAERSLASADVSAFLRRRKVCRLASGSGAPETLWEDLRLSLHDVRDALLPGSEPARAPGLTRRLRRALDRRLLAGLARNEELRRMGPICLALGIDAVTSPEFLRLDALWPLALRGGLTVALAAEEVAMDPAGFAFVRDLLHARGHRVMLDAAGPSALLALPPSRAGVDRLRLRWSDALPALGSAQAESLRTVLPGGPDAVVLSGVDRAAAIAWGWEMGIGLFQGRLMESRRPKG